MQSLIRDLLDFARARHGSGLPVKPEPARLGEICRAAIEEVRTAQPSGAVFLDVTGEDLAALDPARVEQVVCKGTTFTVVFPKGSPEVAVAAVATA